MPKDYEYEMEVMGHGLGKDVAGIYKSDSIGNVIEEVLRDLDVTEVHGIIMRVNGHIIELKEKQCSEKKP